MAIHTWWDSFGEDIKNPDDLTPVLAIELATIAAGEAIPGITVTGLRQSANMSCAGVCMDVEVERPQDLAHSIRAVERIAVLFPFDGGQPSVLSMRIDFPDTPHQNWVPSGMPCSLCIDDRPWAEAQLTATGFDIARRVLLWLSKTARGELHDISQPPDPLFFASQLKFIVPSSTLVNYVEPVELVGFIRQDNPNIIVTRVAQPSDGPPDFTVLAFQARPQGMTRLRHAPHTLAELASELKRCGICLYEVLNSCLRTWAGLENSKIRSLSIPLAIIVAFPVSVDRQQQVNDIRAFITFKNAGEIGVALSVLHVNDSEVGDTRAYMIAIPAGLPTDQDLRIEPAEVHFELDRKLAAAVAGRITPDYRRAVLVGTGSLGSQLSLNLAREGALAWTVVDEDYLLPHNLVRHALFTEDIGAPKADALARKLGGVLGESVAAIQCNVLHPKESARDQLDTALAEADIIIDASASVAVSRHLCDLPEIRARRICAFFNPAGTSIVLLVENTGRSISIRDLEAQYFHIVISEPKLSGHLDADDPGVRYSSACRELTNRIPSSNAALLSALAARGIVQALAADEATVSIWTLKGNGEVQLVRCDGVPITRTRAGEWTIAYNHGLLGDLTALRAAKLPRETGGVLLGIADMSRRAIHVAHALPEPDDSLGTETHFERGIVNLREQITQAVAATMHHLRYVGEWHSHPDGASAEPRSTDMIQLTRLGQELQSEGLPGLMAIAAAGGGFSFLLSGMHEDGEKTS